MGESEQDELCVCIYVFVCLCLYFCIQRVLKSSNLCQSFAKIKQL